MNTRRAFFEDVALLSALAAMVQKEGLAQASDDKLSNFWDSYFDQASRDPNVASRGTADSDLIDPAKKVQLIQATNSGLRYPDTIADSELAADTDVVVTVSPNHFRPAPDDHKAIARSKGAQVRLDLIQTRPIMNLIAPMVWSGLAAWSVDKTTYASTTTTNAATGKKSTTTKVTAAALPPDLKDLDFKDPNNPNAPAQNHVVLMGGTGRMALNVLAVSVNNRLQTVLDKSVQYSSIIAPFFGFAPIAIPALRAFTELLGAVFNHQAVIMNSMPLQVLASKAAKENPHDADSLKIVAGDYIAVPTNQTAALKGNLEQLRIVEGWLVHQDSKADVPVAQRAQDPQVPPVSYVSMSFTVKSLAEAQKDKAKGG